MELLLSKAEDFYKWSHALRDPRTISWPLVESPYPILLLIIVYIFAIRYGPGFMKNRQPLQCRVPLLIYNFAMVVLNAYILIEVVLGAYGASYNVWCDSLVFSNDLHQMRVVTGLWWYYISKPIEFLDTIFFIVRKKNSQLTFLHIYHHLSMVLMWWVVIGWMAGGVSFFAPSINSAVHVVMYSYYGLSAIPACRPFLWWKKYITIFQLLQFVCCGVHAVVVLIVGCDYPQWMLYLFAGYMITFVILFSNFYFHAYTEPKSHTNGASQTSNKKIA